MGNKGARLIRTRVGKGRVRCTSIKVGRIRMIGAYPGALDGGDIGNQFGGLPAGKNCTTLSLLGF